ncbi:hypothetical protein KDA82_25845 [Streptomyces daliensis]|uniref:DUF6879 domain-containing protein n=1 Tax=Streptomyces daliensis TaxID=299421 RepID=A0A8T4J2E6_9ACTN|nr:hypothetical protein [Streptomyces daliensis]
MIAGPAITAFFRDGFEETAWRWETRRAYGVPHESEDFQRFLRGEPPCRDLDRPWLVTMRALREEGKRVGRVRVLDQPPTDYQRWLLEDVLDSVEAGEDIRYLPRAEADGLGVSMRDFWLFDSRTLGLFHYDGDISLGMELRQDPAEVDAARRIQALATAPAQPAAEVVRRVRSSM